MKKLIAAVLFIAGCSVFNYGKALDQCAFDHAGDRAATVQCQCDVAQQNGRSCDFLGADAGASTDAGGQ